MTLQVRGAAVEGSRAWRSRGSTARDTQDLLPQELSPFPSLLLIYLAESQAFKNTCFSPALSERGDDFKASFEFVTVEVHGVKTHLFIC